MADSFRPRDCEGMPSGSATATIAGWSINPKIVLGQCTLIPVSPVRLRDRAVDGGQGVLVCAEHLRAQKSVEALTEYLLTYSFSKACRPIES